ncbi:MAG TPA: cupin domain-containing protein [Sphingobacterium sp.]|nr:cupin domain-containing protein [Sphingobacterium sp.]
MDKNNLNESFGTLSETINGLVKLGYTHDFNIKDECIICHKTNTILSPDDFQIDQVYRFEGYSDPEYQSILYAISSVKHNIKGTLVNGYGIFSDEYSSKLIEKLKTHNTQKVMENKSSDVTPQRPEGERLLNAHLVEMDLLEFMKQIKNETTWVESDRNSMTLFKSEIMRVVLIGLRENAEVKPHKANGVITVQVLEGKITFTTAQQTVQIEKGQMIALQENIVHSVKALTESCFLLTLAMSKK